MSDESAGKIHSRHITKGASTLNLFLIEVAWRCQILKKIHINRCKFEVDPEIVCLSGFPVQEKSDSSRSPRKVIVSI
ncbi:hypothetical protein [Faecalibaculum rodentium]|uniref:hypothetical protein n=1 Tax=Faecalibaculum rodentium TaxID=1702221 RepID=UPI003F677D14